MLDSAAEVNIAPPEEQYNDEEEEKIINEEYKVWKKNTPFLYDTVMTHALEWPSLTCEFLPDKKEVDDTSVQRLILGTHTAGGEANHLMIAEVKLPIENADTDRLYKESTDVAGFGVAASSKPIQRVNIVHKMVHHGEVNRARYCPQNPALIATKSPSANVLLYDYTKHPSMPPAGSEARPDLILRGHTKEGYSLSWNQHEAGQLLSASDDGVICLWDVRGTPKNTREMDALHQFKGHVSAVEDVQYHPMYSNLFASVGDDRKICIWNSREKSGRPVQSITGHTAEINSVAFNPYSEFLFATASADKSIAIWDLRRLTSKLHTIEDAHNNEVHQVKWSPQNETILASSGGDRRLHLWDISKIGDEQDPEDAEDGPPELLFIHSGHTSRVSDFSFNANDNWVISSVADDNILQVWQIADHIWGNNKADDQFIS